MSHRYTKMKPDPRDRFYVDPEDGSYGVFGTESGFCYGLHSDRDEAEKDALERTQAKWPSSAK